MAVEFADIDTRAEILRIVDEIARNRSEDRRLTSAS
jgi:hypothetical protein